jgi:hypothetical protein
MTIVKTECDREDCSFCRQVLFTRANNTGAHPICGTNPSHVVPMRQQINHILRSRDDLFNKRFDIDFALDVSGIPRVAVTLTFPVCMTGWS